MKEFVNIVRDNIYYFISTRGWMRRGKGLHPQNSHTRSSHHICPHISHIHYTKISKIVKETAKEFNLPYNEYKTTPKGIIAHFKHLKEMGVKPALHV